MLMLYNIATKSQVIQSNKYRVTLDENLFHYCIHISNWEEEKTMLNAKMLNLICLIYIYNQ